MGRFLRVKGISLQTLLVGLDHLLGRVTRTTCEFFEVSMRCFAGENLNIQSHGVIIFWSYEDFIDEFSYEFFGDGSGGGSQFHFPHHCFHGFDLFAEFFFGVELLFQLFDLGFRVSNLLGALFVQREKVLVRDGTGDVVFQQLGLFLQGQFPALLLFFDHFGDSVACVQRLEPLNVFRDQGFCAYFGIGGYIQNQRLNLIFINGERGAGIGTVLDFTGTDPAAVFVALFVGRLPAIVGSAAVGAVEFSGEQVCMVADTLAGFYIIAAPFQNGIGGMKGVIAKGITLFDQTGSDMDKACLATYLAESLFAPSILLQDYISFEEISDYEAKATISYKGQTASGIFTFNEQYEYVSFTTNDRAVTNTDGTMEYIPWSAVCGEYCVSESGIKYPTKFKAIWNYADGDFVYFDGVISTVSYDE